MKKLQDWEKIAADTETEIKKLFYFHLLRNTVSGQVENFMTNTTAVT